MFLCFVDFLPINTKDCVIDCISKKDFSEKLSNLITTNLKNKPQNTFSASARLDLLERYFSNSDGFVAERLSKLISEVIN